ncbi:MAG TPA: hypothetical protein VMW90_03055 [Acidobacteriota bacterium]|nr:hypothetical protein [Acidobacteriota bacterium]
MKKLLLVLIPIFLGAVYAYGAYDTESVTREIWEERDIRVVKWAWQCDIAGDVSGAYTLNMTGTLMGVKFAPAVSPDVPSHEYDVVINDADGVDILMGLGADRHQSATYAYNYVTPMTSEGKLLVLCRQAITPVISNAGSGCKGVLWLYFK